jgi:triosephosphate isomerase
MVASKTRAAWRAGLKVIICVGETESERNLGNARDVCRVQLDESVPDQATAANIAIAYEPVWAIGTGRTPTSEDIVAMHSYIRACLLRRLGQSAADVRILYGGSVKPNNAAEILNLFEVNGALVGGASLKSDEFYRIIAVV